jgi:hypothetical protein
MPLNRSSLALILIVTAVGALCLRFSPKRTMPPTIAADAPLEPSIDYNREIQPLLSDRCFACHGPDAGQRQAGLRLDRRLEAVRALAPGNAPKSRLLGRISSLEPDEVMPPPDAHKAPLTPEQIALFRRWIDQGAPYEPHRALRPPTRPTPPAVMRSNWVRNPIDAFLAAEQEKRGLTPAAEADRVTLLRRLSFDLVGLPPTPLELDAFVHDASPDAYEKVVDRLLASPHYGERMAVAWLDLVRYADTDGYSLDSHRDVWPYRDYVIDAFNRNLSFRTFTIQQIAGDLLPAATPQDRIASGYNRLLMTAREGCADPREYKARYAADRVRNLASVWLGLTLGCAECHDHKFDPFPQRDFYRLAAFFADVQETSVGPQEPTLFPSPKQAPRLREVEARLAAAKAEYQCSPPGLAEGRARWEARVQREGVAALPDEVAAALTLLPTQRGPNEEKAIDAHYRSISPELEKERKRLEQVQEERKALVETIPCTLVAVSGPPRPVRLLKRGDWTDESGEIVTPGLPAALSPPFPPRGEGVKRMSRLDLARWLTASNNPLVARVFVNRLWKIAFGRGIVATPEDFGSQGAAATHPELLDWLAVEFVESGWDVKRMLRLIVTSSAYRQESRIEAAARERDPENHWLARQNRFRLDAEFVRDNALAVSGLLCPRIGGRSVKPVQPDDYWAPRFTEKVYHPDRGEEGRRRGLYTYWCRNYLHPALSIFDAPPRQVCTAERGSSATPLQALALLNDPAQGEAARAFARRILTESGPTLYDRLDHAYRLALSRGVKPAEEAILTALLEKHRAEFRQDQAAAERLTRGEAPPFDVAELAAWISAARAILNLHETITRN